MNRHFHICTLFGIPVMLSVSTICLLFFFLGMTGNLLLDMACMLGLLVSIVAHELGHSLVARCFGCETRVITLSVIGGCASLENIPRKAWQEFLTAVAGPAVSFALFVGLYFSFPFVPIRLLANAMAITGIINFTLGAFNLLPGFPMDGGRMFRSAVRAFMSRSRATYWAMAVGRGAAVLLVLGPFVGIDQIWIIPLGGNIFMRILIAAMIWFDGYREYRLAVEEERWDAHWDFSARVSPPPYGGKSKDEEVRRK